MMLKIAKKMGARIVVEPEFRYIGQVIFKNGRRTFFRNTVLSINTGSAMEVSRDKNYSSFFLRRFGYRTPKEQTFFSDSWCRNLKSTRNLAAACRFAKILGYPVILKPNNLSQGRLVTKVRSAQELKTAARKILAGSQIFLVQEFIQGRDYRIVVLDNEIISAYERFPLCVVGTGKDSVSALLKKKQRLFEKTGRDTRIDFKDFRIAWKLRSQGLRFTSIIPRGKEILLLDNANLSTGGESKDVTPLVHKDYKKLVVAITKDMGLRLCGVDLLTSDITKPLDPSHVVLEINAAPGLDHYASAGRTQKKIVEELYEKVLRAIERGDHRS